MYDVYMHVSIYMQNMPMDVRELLLSFFPDTHLGIELRFSGLLIHTFIP